MNNYANFRREQYDHWIKDQKEETDDEESDKRQLSLLKKFDTAILKEDDYKTVQYFLYLTENIIILLFLFIY